VTTTTAQRKRKLPLRTKLAYASGGLEEAMITAASVATMVFYNQVLGVSAALCGTAFLVASIVDAVSDPLAGAWSDRVSTRWGRRHPFMLLAAAPTGACFYLLYQPPRGLTEQQLFLWFTATLVGLRLAKTFYLVPHSALGAELTDDYDERTSIFAWDWLVRSLGAALLGFLLLTVVFPTAGAENGLLRQDRYLHLAVLGGVLCGGVLLFCTLATADQIPLLHRTAAADARTRSSWRDFGRQSLLDLWVLIRNPSYIAVTASWLILSICSGLLAVISTFAFIYAFELTTEQIAIRPIIALPGAFLAVWLSGWLVRRLDKKYTVISTILFGAVMIGLPYCLRLVGWFPANDSPWLLVAFFACWTPGFLCLPLVPIVIDSQLADIADEHELRTGRRSEGIIFSVRTLAIKMTSGLGGLIGGFGLELIDFPANATVGAVAPAAIRGLLWMMGPIYVLIVLVGIGLAFLYRLDRASHAEILCELERRRDRSVAVKREVLAAAAVGGAVAEGETSPFPS
jgi:Na+/melibiose symporter-like transporter